MEAVVQRHRGGAEQRLHATPRTAARWAGAGYLAIFVLAILANFVAIGSVLDAADATATAAQLAESEGLVRLGTIAFLAIFLIDIVVAWALHALLRDVHHDVSLLSAWFRLAYTVMLGVALVFLHLALLLVGESAAAAGATDADVLLALQAFDFTWVAGLAAFGLHLVLIGWLLVRSGRAPRGLGWLLMVAGIAYVVDTVAHIALPDYEAVSVAFLAMVAVPSVVAELGLTVWLLLVAAGRRQPPGGTSASGAGRARTDVAPERIGQPAGR